MWGATTASARSAAMYAPLGVPLGAALDLAALAVAPESGGERGFAADGLILPASLGAGLSVADAHAHAAHGWRLDDILWDSHLVRARAGVAPAGSRKEAAEHAAAWGRRAYANAQRLALTQHRARARHEMATRALAFASPAASRALACASHAARRVCGTGAPRGARGCRSRLFPQL